MRFSKISITKSRVHLTRESKDENGAVEQIDLESPERPLSEFDDALQAFKPYVTDLLPFDLAEDDFTVTTLSLSEDKNGNRGLIVSIQVPVPKAYDKPVSISTPLVREGAEDASDDACVLSDEVMELIQLAETEAARYANGERVQGELFAKKEREAKESETSENAKEFNERAAHAENLSTRKPRGRPGRKGKGPKPSDTGVDHVANPDHGGPVTDERLRELLLKVDRDVSLEAIAKVTSSEREAAFTWADAKTDPFASEQDVPPEPEWVKAFADPSLVVDGWTDPKPPKLDSDAVVAIQDAARGD